ncbi:MAG TPA: hypothetical protein VK804_23940 [Bradyrhizobium sp.]|jgi:hypothetical protein|uniref:hypothetical protein n=1 Tax=Bradyrhizobium sp. TaxID=376 RepID=UPI002B7C04C8|nr:hypothetical protein [Bradyrhizobium sp.]HTB03533.1 hypothetical protein [Bradyrhizobium sp.]
MPDRILIFANKSWEADPLVGVFRNAQARPANFPPEQAPPQVSIPLNDGSARNVSARLSLASASATVDVWCIKDMMDPARSSSSSEEKARVLPLVAASGPRPKLVIAFGTAAYPDSHSYNGCPTIGANCFVYNPYAATPNPASQWTHPDIGKLLDSSTQPVNAEVFTPLDQQFRSQIEQRFLPAPLNGAAPPTLNLSAGYAALSDVNVTDFNNYYWTDPEALKACAQAAPRQAVASVETTHGVIRLMVPSDQFLFVSGIANRMGYFNMEAAPRSYAQSFVASHNAAVALAWMTPLIM